MAAKGVTEGTNLGTAEWGVLAGLLAQVIGTNMSTFPEAARSGVEGLVQHLGTDAVLLRSAKHWHATDCLTSII